MGCMYETEGCKYKHCITCSYYKIGNVTTESYRGDGIYMQLFAIKDGARYDMKTIGLNVVSKVLVDSLMDGIEKLCK